MFGAFLAGAFCFLRTFFFVYVVVFFLVFGPNIIYFKRLPTSWAMQVVMTLATVHIVWHLVAASFSGIQSLCCLCPAVALAPTRQLDFHWFISLPPDYFHSDY